MKRLAALAVLGALVPITAAEGAEPLPSARPEQVGLSSEGLDVSTAMDYARFCQALLGGGRLEGARILSRTTVSLMTSDHLGPIAAAGPSPTEGFLGTPGYTFGLGFAVRRDAGVAAVHGSAGDYTWGGAAGTYFWIDPRKSCSACS